MDKLIEGYRRFRAEVWPGERDRYEALAIHGQSPRTLVLTCSDSRVDPATVFGAGPGELFVVRNVAALAPPYTPDGGCHGTSAALEYGVRVLKVERIVVMGHARCGGVQGVVEGVPEEARDFVAPWVEAAAPVRDHVADVADREDRLRQAEHDVVRLSLANLMTFPWIAEAVDAGRLKLEGFYFGIQTGELLRLDGSAFKPVS